MNGRVMDADLARWLKSIIEQDHGTGASCQMWSCLFSELRLDKKRFHEHNKIYTIDMEVKQMHSRNGKEQRDIRFAGNAFNYFLINRRWNRLST